MILNFTQHAATPEQIAQGVVDLPEARRQELCQLLTFEELPAPADVRFRAEMVADLYYEVIEDLGADLEAPTTEGWPSVMVGGAPFFMGPLESALISMGLEGKVLYAFSRRESVEETQPDGSVVKRNVFRHVGFVYND